ncbi:MAG: hypothetical protein ABW019_13070 [Chitinophagaceae bacterium]
MEIKNIDGLSAAALQKEVATGARFVYFQYTLSLLVVTLKRTSGVYLIRSHENAVSRSFPYTLISFLFGWWGVPWGPKCTLDAIQNNLRGGKNVTDDVMAVVAGHVLYEETEGKRKAELSF